MYQNSVNKHNLYFIMVEHAQCIFKKTKQLHPLGVGKYTSCVSNTDDHTACTELTEHIACVWVGPHTHDGKGGQASICEVRSALNA